jgi:hypothetical protein
MLECSFLAHSIRGLITFVIGFFTFFFMPPSPTQTKTWFRPKGWFSEREETIMVSRILRDDPSKVSLQALLQAMIRNFKHLEGGYA